jgi:hypothetical protein
MVGHAEVKCDFPDATNLMDDGPKVCTSIELGDYELTT